MPTPKASAQSGNSIFGNAGKARSHTRQPINPQDSLSRGELRVMFGPQLEKIKRIQDTAERERLEALNQESHIKRLNAELKDSLLMVYAIENGLTNYDDNGTPPNNRLDIGKLNTEINHLSIDIQNHKSLLDQAMARFQAALGLAERCQDTFCAKFPGELHRKTEVRRVMGWVGGGYTGLSQRVEKRS